MKFKIIGPLSCAPSREESKACPMTYTVSVMGYSGVSFLSSKGTPLEKETVFRLVDAVYTTEGINFIYSFDPAGSAEGLIGEIVESMRDQIVLSSKHTGSGSPANIEAVFEQHLLLLRTSYIDLYFFEYDGVTPVEESMPALQALLDKHQIKGIGLSNVTPQIIEKAHRLCSVSAVQVSYSLWDRTIENDGTLALCKHLGITCIPCNTAEIGYVPRTAIAYEPETESEKLALGKLQELATSKGITTAQLEFAWLIQQGCIPFTTSSTLDTLKLDATSAHIKLDSSDLEIIDYYFPAPSSSHCYTAAGPYSETHSMSAESDLKFSHN